MGLAASQGRLLLLTARQNDLEYQAQQISQQRLALAQKLNQISEDYENATSNRQMKINVTNDSTTAVNLTYAALVSGASALGVQNSNLNKVIGINSLIDGSACTTAYRLVCGDAIVVSDVSEIPGKVTSTSSTTSSSTDTESKFKTYDQTYTSISGSTTSTITKKYISIDSFDTSSDLYKVITDEDEAENCSMKTDGTNYYIYYDGQYYDQSGAAVTPSDTSALYNYTYSNNTNDSSSTGKVQFVKSSSNIPDSTTASYETVTESDLGSNNSISVNGITYIVDEYLTKNTSDGSAINYIQECLRNGKYTIEQYNSQATTSSKWQEISWDSAIGITDYYYEDDDTAAKAKYDRLSNQVETQDKKLQLDLDNIETQRDAIKTELESVQTVIKDNVEKTFDAFG